MSEENWHFPDHFLYFLKTQLLLKFQIINSHRAGIFGDLVVSQFFGVCKMLVFLTNIIELLRHQDFDHNLKNRISLP